MIGIEPPFTGWKPAALPLDDTRIKLLNLLDIYQPELEEQPVIIEKTIGPPNKTVKNITTAINSGSIIYSFIFRRARKCLNVAGLETISRPLTSSRLLKTR